MIVTHEHHLQIERIIYRNASGNCRATFHAAGYGGRLLCEATVWRTGQCKPIGGSQVHVPQSNYSVELASALSIALSMAIDWTAEEMAK